MSKEKKVKEYDPEKSYIMGEHIFHKGFDEIGEIVGTGMTTDQIKNIVVVFPKAGQKRLVIDYKKNN
ncbi:MAG: hypothetical protein PHQ23_03725 [Candidatus Wallbacteria bacterium]|nr:hypothetical protein [Candidatus Wallbacteria bacterium]